MQVKVVAELKAVVLDSNVCSLGSWRAWDRPTAYPPCPGERSRRRSQLICTCALVRPQRASPPRGGGIERQRLVCITMMAVRKKASC